jgi:hypothetical protein
MAYMVEANPPRAEMMAATPSSVAPASIAMMGSGI